MKKQLSTWKLIADSLQKQTPVMLLYVLESNGSSPGRQGFFMCVNASGQMEGSVGGGIMEHKFVEMAKERLKEQEGKAQEIRKQIHDKTSAKNQSGMICSGDQTILLYQIQQSDSDHINKIISCLEKNNNATLSLSPSGIIFSENVPQRNFEFAMISEDNWSYKEKLGYKNQLFIIGGGHCSLSLSRLMSGMDFYISLYDDRKNLKTMEENEFVHEKYVIDDYTKLKQLIGSGEDHYVVIMTFGYRTDDIALKALLGKKFKYLGLLGSKKKIEKVFTGLQQENIPEDVIKTIHSPVGISINSETPEEIAISIAAEIIKVKNA